MYHDDIIKYGESAAKILGLIENWCNYHKEKGMSQCDGNYWSGFLSRTDFMEQTLLSESTVKRTLKYLINNHIIQRGNFNKRSYDATGWYRRLDQDEPQPRVSMTPPTVHDDPPGGFTVTPPPGHGDPNYTYNSSNTLYKSDIMQYAHKEIIEQIRKEISLHGKRVNKHMIYQLEKWNEVPPKQKEDIERHNALLQLKEEEPELFNLK